MAFGASTISNVGAGVQDLFSADAYKYKAQGAQFEKENYDLAANLADKNAQYTEWTTGIKSLMADRTTYQALGSANASIGASGLKASGSSLDLLHESAANGQLAKETAITQGNITEAGYQEQAQSYRNMSAAADVAIKADKEASLGSAIGSVFKLGAAAASIFAAPLTGGASLAIGGLFMGGGSPSGYGSGG